MTTRVRAHQEEDEESYFISMTDLIVGLLFIFIIMLMFFALQYRQATSDLVNSDEVRDQILEDLRKRLLSQHIEVVVVRDQGILRLPEAILFDKNSAELNSKGKEAVAVLADALDAVLPCYTSRNVAQAQVAGCDTHRATIESIYIEGHSDSDPLVPRAGVRDNLDLSAIRAATTFQLLIQDPRHNLLSYLNRNSFPVLSVSGYGEFRPVERNAISEAQKAANRRIDLRILMSAPRLEDAQRFDNDLNQQTGR